MATVSYLVPEFWWILHVFIAFEQLGLQMGTHEHIHDSPLQLYIKKKTVSSSCSKKKKGPKNV